MLIVAHNGPNWTRDSLSTTSQHVAIAVRNTVLIYSHDATFQTELRATGGSSRISSISFCTAPCLTSLLAVANQAGHVRIFDVDARRIFRVLLDAGASCFAVRFLESMPFRVLVVSDKLCVFDIVQDARMLVQRQLPFKHVFAVELIPNLSSHVLIAGKRNDGACLCVVNLYEQNDTHVLVTGFAVHDVAVRHRPNHTHPYFMAVTSARLSYPMFFTSQNGIQWTRLPDVKPYVPRQMCTADNYEKQKQPLRSKLLRTAVCWDVDHILYTTDTKGTIYAWEVDDACQMRLFAQRHYAHSRQIFAVKSVQSRTVFSISMDRTLAKWRITQVAQPFLALQWRSLRTHGPVTALSISNQHRSIHEAYISYTSASNSIACVRWAPTEDGFRLEAEASPSDPQLGKRNREMVSYVTTPDQLFDQSLSFVKDPSQSHALFVFGFSDGKRGTFSVRDGKVIVNPCQNDHSVTLGQAMGADIIKESNKMKESTNKNSVPSDLIDRKKRAKAHHASLMCAPMLENVIEGDIVTGACLVRMQHHDTNDKACFLVGSAKGLLYFVSKGTEITLLSESLSLSSIICLEYEPASSLIAVSDTDGVLVTLKWGGTESLSQANEAKTHTDTKCANRYDLTSAVRFMRWSENASESHKDAPISAYLLLALQNGETVVWVSDAHGRLRPRAQIREHRGPINGAVWFDRKYILTAGEDGTIRSWEVDRLPQFN